MLGLMRTLAQEWGPYRVNVNAVAFGQIQTRFGLPQSEQAARTSEAVALLFQRPTRRLSCSG
jgi:NAD(P)-dependent dehydrogenase (short-subunit alcohol dehydrogenase family)